MTTGRCNLRVRARVLSSARWPVTFCDRECEMVVCGMAEISCGAFHDDIPENRGVRAACNVDSHVWDIDQCFFPE